MRYWVAAMKKYAVFSGRASRKEYWMFVLMQILIGLVLLILATAGLGEAGISIFVLYILGTQIPGLSVAVRRLHDIGVSGWWMVVISFIPLAYLGLIRRGDESENKYGPPR